ncbi:MAG TPA: SagB/ThcOx family dehydrogenase [Gemmatimonadales bacterium]|nr:SagB/ThcOx family dehydrogenase [Gemmatimonadales bacterium]
MKPLLAALAGLLAAAPAAAQPAPASAVPLPAPRHAGALSLEAALWARQSVRTLARDSSVGLADAAQLLWAAQGVNRANGHRTAPSAGAAYPLELYLVASRVRDLAPGVYHYRPATHDLEPLAAGDRLRELVDAAVHQAWVADAAGVIVFAAVYQRAAQRFGSRAERFVPMDVGFAGENVYLEAAALGLGTTFAGSVDDTAAARVLGLGPEARALGVMPFGRPR